MDSDLAETATDMAMGREYNRGRKIEPAYQHVDVFERQRIEQQIRRQREERFNPNRHYIQPNPENEPEIMVVYPDE